MNTHLVEISPLFALVPDSNGSAQAVVAWTDKKGTEHNTTPEGCLWRGGVALRQLKDAAVNAAVAKVTHGRYRAAVDIMAAAFPGIDRAAAKFLPGAAWACKADFVAYCRAVAAAEVKRPYDAQNRATRQTVAKYMASEILAMLDPQPEEPDAPVANADGSPMTE